MRRGHLLAAAFVVLGAVAFCLSVIFGIQSIRAQGFGPQGGADYESPIFAPSGSLAVCSDPPPTNPVPVGGNPTPNSMTIELGTNKKRITHLISANNSFAPVPLDRGDFVVVVQPQGLTIDYNRSKNTATVTSREGFKEGTVVVQGKTGYKDLIGGRPWQICVTYTVWWKFKRTIRIPCRPCSFNLSYPK